MRLPTLDSLERIAQRMESGGKSDAIAAQLEMNKPLDTRQSRKALWQMVQQVRRLIEQCLYLEQTLESVGISLNAEKKMNLELRVQNHRLTREVAEVEKQNRNLKREIEKLVKYGGL